VQLIDTHTHFWDPRRLAYSWLRGNAHLNRPYLVQDYPADSVGTQTEAFVFVECDADRRQSLEEIDFVEEQARRDSRVRAIVAHAPLEYGKAAEPLLERIVGSSSRIRGIRRILQSERDLSEFLRSTAFVEGVGLLPSFGLHFEVTVTWIQMPAVLELVQRLPQVVMVLDHCGKPGIRDGRLEEFQHHARALAQHPNVHCKLSGLATEADHAHWRDAQLLPFIDIALQAFGPGRLIYGSDWPVCLQAGSLERWVGVLEEALGEYSPAERRRIFRDNAKTLYRI
jgi:L-fuconolactonase